MEKQANLTPELRDMQTSLQMKFSKFEQYQRERIANYLNMYNTTAWMYNEILSEDERTYVDLSMQYVMETQRLEAKMKEVSGDPAEVQQIVDSINDEQ